MISEKINCNQLFLESGCDTIPEANNSRIQYESHKAIVRLFCDFNYSLAGNSVSYCNGTKWDRTLGYCRGEYFPFLSS